MSKLNQWYTLTITECGAYDQARHQGITEKTTPGDLYTVLEGTTLARTN